jgi:hypothetical protein
MAAVVWVFFTIPDGKGFQGEAEITGFPIFYREITLEIYPEKAVAASGGDDLVADGVADEVGHGM